MYDIDYVSPPAKPFEEIVSHYRKADQVKGKYVGKETIFILDDVLENEATITALYQDLLDLMKYGIEKEEIRHLPINFKIHREDSKVHTLPANNFLSNLIFWNSFITLDAVDAMDDSYILEMRGASLKKYMHYMNTKILPNAVDVDFRTKNAVIDDIVYHITCISYVFTIILGLGMSIHSIYQVTKQCPEALELMKKPIDLSMQPSEVEKDIAQRNNRMIEIFSTYDNDFKPFFGSDSGLSRDQFKEIMVRIGTKSDVNGQTIPVPLDCNILYTGINKPSYYYINGDSGRKAQIVGKIMMAEPGYLSKLMTMNSISFVVRDDYETCDAHHYVSYEIKSKDHLNALDQRYYVWGGKLRLLDAQYDEHLIGKVLNFRSPITCTSDEGICRICYGPLFDTNKDLASQGSYAAIKNAGPTGQSYLSQKHSQKADSHTIQMSPAFDEAFELFSTTINVRANTPVDYGMIINDLGIEQVGETNKTYCTELTLINLDTGERQIIKEENGAKLYLSGKTSTLNKRVMKEINHVIPLDEFDDTEEVFYVEVKSEGVSGLVKKLSALLDNKDHMGHSDYSSLCQAYLDLNIDNGINNNAVHNELVIKSLIRKASNKYEYADFSNAGNPDDYQILRLTTALSKNPSPAISLTAGYLKSSLVSTEFYEQNATSFVDPSLMVDLSKVHYE